jgi:hypothetical protein
VRTRSVVLLLAAVGLAIAAGRTVAFTTAADVVTALGLAAFVTVLALQWPRAGRRTVEGRVWPWVVTVVVVVGWELETYLASGTRAAHPTLSSMADAVERYWGLKALMFFAWLLLGWGLARRPREERARGGEASG